MKTLLEINIDDYLSESEKKQYAIEAFKEQVKSELFKTNKGSIQSDSEIQRIIGNITSQIVMNEVQKYIPECEEMIKSKTIEALSKDNYSYYVFKKKDAWDREESLAVTYMNETIKDCKQLFQNKIKQTIENYDVSKDVSEKISDEFANMADTIYKLAELFQSKSN